MGDEERLELQRINGQLHRARKRNAECDPPAVIAAHMKSLYGRPCWFGCGKPSEHADHVYPLSRGGSHTVENLRPACQFHNISKGAKDPIEFVISLFGDPK